MTRLDYLFDRCCTTLSWPGRREWGETGGRLGVTGPLAVSWTLHVGAVHLVLRKLACREIMSKLPNFIYLPAFTVIYLLAVT